MWLVVGCCVPPEISFFKINGSVDRQCCSGSMRVVGYLVIVSSGVHLRVIGVNTSRLFITVFACCFVFVVVYASLSQ